MVNEPPDITTVPTEADDAAVVAFDALVRTEADGVGRLEERLGVGVEVALRVGVGVADGVGSGVPGAVGAPPQAVTDPSRSRATSARFTSQILPPVVPKAQHVGNPESGGVVNQ